METREYVKEKFGYTWDQIMAASALEKEHDRRIAQAMDGINDENRDERVDKMIEWIGSRAEEIDTAQKIVYRIKQEFYQYQKTKIAQEKRRHFRQERERKWNAQGRTTCGRCGGEGGWRGWPGYTCYDCGGRGWMELG